MKLCIDGLVTIIAEAFIPMCGPHCFGMWGVTCIEEFFEFMATLVGK
jgi:hypothetical protein